MSRQDGGPETLMENPPAGVASGGMRPREMEPEEAAAWLRERGGVRLLDVREPAERAVARIAGSTLATPGTVHEVLEEWPRDTPILVYCHHGSRSRLMSFRLLAEGFTDVVNLSGGIEEWSKRVDPAVPRYEVRYGQGVVRI
jgi:rhodanese-related sulfurtransferase